MNTANNEVVKVITISMPFTPTEYEPTADLLESRYPSKNESVWL